MLSRLIVFASLFLLPHFTTGFNVTDHITKSNWIGCRKSKFEGGTYCFELYLARAIQPSDNRLLPTKIVFAHRNEKGQITAHYPSYDIAPWIRKLVKKQETFNVIPFYIDMPYGIAEYNKDAVTINEFYFYFGSDNAQMYPDLKYGYSADFMQLKRETNFTCLTKKFEYEIRGIFSSGWKVGDIKTRHIIFTPGIYLMTRESDKRGMMYSPGKDELSEVTFDPVTNYDHLNYHGDYCHQPFSGVSKFEGAEMIMTTYCFKLSFHHILPKDNRLLPTAIAFLVVDNEGKIVERYRNNDISSWVREKSKIQRELNEQFDFYTFQMQFPGNVEESNSTLEKITDFILYFGSDHAQIYDRPDAVFNPENLQLSELPTDDLSRNFYLEINQFYDWNGKQIDTAVPEFDMLGLNCTVSKPGIYRIRKGKKDATEMHYDPMDARNTHMHLK